MKKAQNHPISLPPQSSLEPPPARRALPGAPLFLRPRSLVRRGGQGGSRAAPGAGGIRGWPRRVGGAGDAAYMVIPDILLTVDWQAKSREIMFRAKIDKGIKFVVDVLISSDFELF